MTIPVYSIRRIYKQGPIGITSPKFCTMNAVLKHDSQDIPCCVYNERVATNLAQTMHIPNAAGVLADTPGAHSFASLEISSPKMPLPNIRESWSEAAVESYPEQTSALIAFDILIGNADRYQNLKVSLFTPEFKIFTAFDHSHSLLHPWYKISDAITLLRSDNLIAETHPFYGYILQDNLFHWCNRITETPDYLIRECCEFGRPINTVDITTQKKLGQALVNRKKKLLEIVKNHQNDIQWK